MERERRMEGEFGWPMHVPDSGGDVIKRAPSMMRLVPLSDRTIRSVE